MLLMIFKSAKYPLATINKLLDVFGDNQAIGSDIGCSLSKTVAASPIQDKAFNRKLSLSVNAFHGHAHNRKCQLQYHPMYLHGFGLKDLKTFPRPAFLTNGTWINIWNSATLFSITTNKRLP
ncbi:hypothetical protein BDR03DRAFT_1016527 [Suillus americanus]|nr:hypothetical protein BDR03DRAFT_1016527 [Suillus americanus]